MHDDDGEIFIRYTEEIGLKTNEGGIKHRNISPKEVDLYPIDDEEKCPVCTIIKYLLKLPSNIKCQSFYLQPRKKFLDLSWYQDRPVGVHKLWNCVKEMCKTAKLPGFYSNHSLHSTSATRMYKNNIDEQLIMEITGHRSNAVRSYKKTLDYQRKVASNCLFSQ